MLMASVLPRYGLLSSQALPSFFRLPVSTGWGTTSPWALAAPAHNQGASGQHGQRKQDADGVS